MQTPADPNRILKPISSLCIRQLAGKLELGEFALQLAVIFPVFRSQISKPENSENEGGYKKTWPEMQTGEGRGARAWLGARLHTCLHAR